MASIELDRITKRFKDTVVLDDVSLSVEDGETLALFGPSGAGKTILLRLLAGVIEPDAGRVLIGGHDMADVAPEHRRIGMAFQNFALFPHMSAFENIASPLKARRTAGAALSEGVDKIARLLKIDHVLTHSPRALSNGQKQRTALARALAGEPDVLLLDDPLRNVDAKLRFEMRLELPQVLARQQATAIYVTQDYKEAMALGDRIAVLSGGRIVQVGKPEDIYLTPADVETAQLFGDPTINLLDVTPELDDRGPFVCLSDRRMPLDPGLRHAVGRKCRIGMRAEAIRFVGPDDPGAIAVTVEAETPLNEKAVTLTVTKRGREILVSRPSETQGPSDTATHIAIDTAHALLFDRDSGQRIAPGAAADQQAGAAA
ncbi:ABC transporter ATP-binding protein [Rhodovibrio salinarum]|uniref:ABC transporter ATP-binding protein n=1 Tax=Rhodovibrio salinarum TaxID=1087 RepID=A0A934QEC2_9PROT|nr:ABC transporter ATP-binding protein [Rhodovibrio salinarum]MBK1695752.1 ABC transporter ATP-binding protein [Rhodovibrio salinarum]